MERVKFNTNYLPFSQYTRPGNKIEKVLSVVIHYVNNPGTSASFNRDWFLQLGRTGESYGSCHYIVDIDGSILKIIPENEKAYHAGGRKYTTLARGIFFDHKLQRTYPHDKCIGIEVCHVDSTGRFTPETYTQLVALTADIAIRHNLKSDNILRHYDITGKNCPAWFVQNSNEWEQFKLDVIANVESWK